MRSDHQHLHGAAEPRCPGETAIRREQARIELLSQGDVEGVVGGEVAVQLPGPGPEGTAGVTAQAEVIRGGLRLQGMTILQVVAR